MRGRYQASLVAAATAVFALLIPPLLVFSIAAVALPTLRLGRQEGLLVIAGAALLAGLFLLPIFALGAVLEAVQLLVFYWFPGWLTALVLRWSVSLSFTVSCAAGFALVGVLGFYLLLPSPERWGIELLQQMLAPLLASGQLGLQRPVLEDMIQLVGPFVPGLVVSGFITLLLGGLLMGRWWQALLYHPGGFRAEFHALNLGQLAALLSLGVLGLSLLLPLPLLANLLPTLLVLYTVQSFALVHGIVARAKLSQGWLIGFYLMVMFAPQFMLLVILLALVDPWVDFRGRCDRPRSDRRGNGPS